MQNIIDSFGTTTLRRKNNFKFCSQLDGTLLDTVLGNAIVASLVTGSLLTDWLYV